MEELTSRYCDYAQDQQRLTDLWLAQRTAAEVWRYPTLWRLRLLLTSRVWEPEKDTQLWETAAGQLIGLALLWRRTPTASYVVLDGFIHPQFATPALRAALLQWSDQRAQEIANAQPGPLNVYAAGFSPLPCRAELWAQAGYAVAPPNPVEHNVYYAKSLRAAALQPPTLAGYQIRPLCDVDDLEAYQALYGFAAVNRAHQKALIASDEYCHLVMAAPHGELVAYCECSICQAEWAKTQQRIGWVDYVETQPAQQRQGLGQAILVAGLLQLQAWGAETAMLVTVSTNLAARRLYAKMGFEMVEIEEPTRYQKQFSADKPPVG